MREKSFRFMKKKKKGKVEKIVDWNTAESSLGLRNHEVGCFEFSLLFVFSSGGGVGGALVHFPEQQLVIQPPI